MTDFVTEKNMALLTDFYEFTMCAAYFSEKRDEIATFELAVREMPPNRSYLVCAGIEAAVDYLENLRFDPESLNYLEKLGHFDKKFIKFLSNFRFTGELRAIPEGNVLFPNEPIIQVTAPLPEAQLVESFLLNGINFQTMIASKASRVVQAAKGRAVIDFGLRRTHGADAGLKAARSAYLAGCAGTSNTLAAMKYKLPVYGTVAHSFVMSYQKELESFRAYAKLFPAKCLLLIDTYDTHEGAKNAVIVAKELRKLGKRLVGVRIDSGDLASLAKDVRKILDDGGEKDAKILASGDLDEYRITDLLDSGAPIDLFGVGTALGTSSDSPTLNVNYKITEIAMGNRRIPKMKLSQGKVTVPGKKEVIRLKGGRFYSHDIISLQGEPIKGEKLTEIFMKKGKRFRSETLERIRKRCIESVSSLPPEYRLLEPKTYPVQMSKGVYELSKKLIEEIQKK